MSDRVEDSWSITRAGNALLMREGDRKYDLHERTARFGESILVFVKGLPRNAVNHRLISQLVGCATSVGANYCEAAEAVSKKDFCLKISFCRKEARETQFFLRMIATAEESHKDEARKLWREARELHLIFCAILRNAKGASYRSAPKPLESL